MTNPSITEKEGRVRTAAVLTVSDRGARGESVDTAGPAVVALLVASGYQVRAQVLLPDEPVEIATQLQHWADELHVDLVLTAGGTGLSPRDRTPEATSSVLDYAVPGLPEAMRAAGLLSTRMAMLSRAVAGVRGRTLILNLPGSERGATESLRAVLDVLLHAIDQLAAGDHDAPSRAG